MELSQNMAESRIAELGMDDMPLLQYQPTPTALAPDWFKQYRELTHRFMESLMDSSAELSFMSLTEDEFMNLIMGRAMPTNTSLRFRIPLTWGGKLEIENMFLCQTFPFSHKLDCFILEQSGNKNIWLPNPKHKIYIPAHTATGGAGGNATSDRLSQMSAIMSSNSME